MSAPYREPGGTPCPRCQSPLLHDDTDELRCGNGCGTWVGNARLPLDPVTLRKLSRSNPFRATALPFTRCLVCTLSLNDLYNGTTDVLALGQCLEHGVWIERADLAAFVTSYERDIETQTKARMRAERQRRREEAARAREQQVIEQTPLPELVKQLLRRVAELEQRVAELERR